MARIDHAFVDPRLEVINIEVPDTELTRAASDHLPLIVDMRLPPRPSGEVPLTAERVVQETSSRR